MKTPNKLGTLKMGCGWSWMDASNSHIPQKRRGIQTYIMNEITVCKKRGSDASNSKSKVDKNMYTNACIDWLKFLLMSSN